jgi:sugar O-acyltransferase (sialic acid O-acetyltransferase NeuD family)
MSKSYAIWGCSGHAKVLMGLIKSQGDQIVAFFDNKEVTPLVPDVPFYLGENGFREWLNVQKETSKIIGLVAIGGHQGGDRLMILNIFRSAELSLSPLIHPNASVCETANIGEGSQVLAHAVVAADCKIGQGCIINHNVTLDHECVLGDGVHLAPGATICGLVTIGNNVMIGAGAVVLPRLTIASNSIIGAGAIITKNIIEQSIVVGNPGRIIKLRSKNIIKNY